MSRKRVGTGLKGYEGPFFPVNLFELNTVCGNGTRCIANLETIGKTVDGFEGAAQNVITEDGCKWFCALCFRTTRGRLIVLFPWVQDWEEQDGVRLDRSIALYKEGTVGIREMVEITRRLCLAMEKWDKGVPRSWIDVGLVQR